MSDGLKDAWSSQPEFGSHLGFHRKLGLSASAHVHFRAVATLAQFVSREPDSVRDFVELRQLFGESDLQEFVEPRKNHTAKLT
jgi:hypothetical protein